MGLKTEIDNLDGVEEAFHALYTEQNGKFVLTGVDGMVPSSQLAAVKTEAGGYRIELKKVKNELDTFKTLGTLEEIQLKLDEIPVLQEAAKGKIDEKKLEAIANAKAAPLIRERDMLKSQLDASTALNTDLTQRERTRTLADQVRSAASTLKLLPEAFEDAILMAERVLEVGEDGVAVVKDKAPGFIPGSSVKDWLTDMQVKRPHWWGPSQGGGSAGNRGGGFSGPNPWAAETWNLTEQGKIVRQDRKKADNMASAAGTTVGGLKPTGKSK